MKITESQLKRIINEEIDSALNEEELEEIRGARMSQGADGQISPEALQFLQQLGQRYPNITNNKRYQEALSGGKFNLRRCLRELGKLGVDQQSLQQLMSLATKRNGGAFSARKQSRMQNVINRNGAAPDEGTATTPAEVYREIAQFASDPRGWAKAALAAGWSQAKVQKYRGIINGSYNPGKQMSGQVDNYLYGQQGTQQQVAESAIRKMIRKCIKEEVNSFNPFVNKQVYDNQWFNQSKQGQSPDKKPSPVSISTDIKSANAKQLDSMIKSTGLVGQNLSGWYVKLSQALKNGQKVVYTRMDGKKYYLSQSTLDMMRSRYNELYFKGAPNKLITPNPNITKAAGQA